MKNLKFLFALAFSAVLSSCLDTEEKIVLNDDNSGSYSMALDMGKMLSMAASMGGGDKSAPEKGKEKKDTTVYLKDMVNAADNLTPEEKAIFQNAVISIKMDEAQHEMKIVMSTPFGNAAGLMEIKKNFGTVLNKLKAFEKASGEHAKAGDDVGDMKMDANSANPVEDQFTFKAGPGLISNTITNIQAFKDKVASDSTLGMMSQMTAMMGDINYNIIIVLPKAVKKYDGPGSTITEDKRTLHFATTLTEMMEHPEKVSYKVEY